MVDETSPVLEAAKRPDYRVTFERLSDSIDALYQDIVVLLNLLLNVFVDLFVDSLADYWERGVFSRNNSNHHEFRINFPREDNIELRISFVIPVSK